MKLTLSCIKADIGGFPGHSTVHPDLVKDCRESLSRAKAAGTLIDFSILTCGDDIFLVMTHSKGVNNAEIHKLAWDTFTHATQIAKQLKLYGAGQDLLVDAFSGNVKGMGPGCAEAEFEERGSEPIIVFCADKTSPGAWNLALYKMFADPFNTAGLIIDPAMHEGFVFEVHDVNESKKIFLKTPEEQYDLLALIGTTDRYYVQNVFTRKGEVVASTSTQKLAHIAGKYVGKDDPVMFVRAQRGLPAMGEVLEPFTFPYLVKGWMRGSHQGPLMPCAFDDARPSRFDGPPRAIAAGYQLAEGQLHGPVDMFAGSAFDEARRECTRVANYMRRHGPFEPHRLPEHEMEYTTLPQIQEKLSQRWAPIEEPSTGKLVTFDSANTD
jgi:fructose 1,6-bisphosphate aldolase/phosphatase